MGMIGNPNPLYDTVETQLSTVLMAIRYGQGRATYAADDAVGLAETFWDRFPRYIRVQLIEDWDFVLRSGTGMWRPTEEVRYRWENLRNRLQRELEEA